MAAKAISYKNWCEENITPQSWPRILLKCIDLIRSEGFTIKDLENPGDTVELSPSLLEAFNNAMQELYDMRVEENSLA